MSADHWYYAQGGRAAGPVRIDTLKKMAASGDVFSTDMFWREGLSDWTPGHQVKEIFPEPSPGKAPPPLPPIAVPYAAPSSYTAAPKDIGRDSGIRLLLPVGRSGWAIAAGYLGLFSILLLPAPFAIAASLFAIREIKRDPRKHGMGRAIFGLVMGILGCFVILFFLGSVIFDR